MTNPLDNQRGLALVITLLVVTLLTIIVFEFTFSSRIDRRMARNSLSNLQATLLARSGINLGESLLLADEERNFDAYVEDWGRIDELDTQLLVPENMRLKVRVEDEMGKLNINLTRPANPNECRGYLDRPPNARYNWWLTALERLDPETATIVHNHWSKLCEQVNQLPPQTSAPGARTPTPTPGAAAAPTPEPTETSGQDWTSDLRSDFATLDDAAARMSIPNIHLQRLRRWVTALPTRVAGQRPGVNVNTAPYRVLMAICGDDGAVRDIIAKRQESGISQGEIGSLCPVAAAQEGEATTNPGAMFVATSSFFNVRASAIVNFNPMTGRGGIRRTVSMLVQRAPATTTQASRGGNTGAIRWTLTALDWQKEGGAALFSEKPDEESGDDGSDLAAAPMDR